MGVLIITHYQRILHLVQPDRVHDHVSRGGSSRRAARSSSTQLEARGLRLDPRRGRGGGVTAHGRRCADTATRPRVPRRCDARRALVYLDSARDVADAARRSSTRWTTTTRHHRAQRAPRRLPARRRGDRAVRGRARAHRRAALGCGAEETIFTAQRHRGDQPRRLRVGRAERRRRATAWCSPRWSTTRTSCPGSCSRCDAAPSSPTSPSTTTGRLDLDALDALLARGDVKLVAVAHVSNVLGHDQPGRRDRRAAPTPPARSSSSTARRPCRRCRSTSRALDADFYAWTGHKAYGPTGIGVLHGRARAARARCRRSSAAGT